MGDLALQYVDALSSASLPGANNQWLNERRAAALDLFKKQGFPTTSLEEWKYTRVKAVESTLYGSARADVSADEIAAARVPELDAHTLVFVNGAYNAELSSHDLSGDIVVTSLATGLDCSLANACEMMREHLGEIADPASNGFVALNTAAIADGAYVHVPKGVVVDKPIELLFISKSGDQPLIAQPRNLFVLEANAEASVIESYVSLDDGDCLTNAVTEVVLRENAGLKHYKVLEEGKNAKHVHWIEADQAATSRFASYNAVFGGQLARTDLNSHLNGEGADVTMNGLYRLDGRQHCDFHTLIDHAVPHCTSNEFFKGVLDGRSRGVFNGKVYVAEHAQKTDSVQKNDNLLLSGHAEVDTKPQLEIYADDVKCAHGATVGQLHDQSLFYLRSRGIDPDAARSLLVFAFANEVLQTFPLEPLRLKLEKTLIERMPESSAHLEELL